MTTADHIVGVDPHRRRFTAAILDGRGCVVAIEPFANDIAGYVEATAWANECGPIDRWGIENAASLGRHLAEFLIDDGYDVRDVPPHRTTRRRRGRHEGKSDRGPPTLHPEQIPPAIDSCLLVGRGNLVA